MKIISLAFLLYAISIVAGRQASSTSDTGQTSPLNEEYEKIVTAKLKKSHVAGLAVAVVSGNETFSKGYDLATLPDKKVTPETLFHAGSTTKSFTAAAASLLIGDTANSSEPLTWGTNLSSLMRDDFVLPDEWTTDHVSLEDALSHRSGLGRHDSSYGGNTTVRDTVRSFRYLPLTYEIRTSWQYNNLMYFAVAHAIELYTKSWLGDFLSQRIWKPLNMFNTFFALKDTQAAIATRNLTLATPYTWSEKKQAFLEVPWLEDPVVAGAGGIISNVLEYTKWLRCHMDETLPLSPAGHEQLHYPRMTFMVPPLPEPLTYCLGWMRLNYRGEPIYFHQGALSGFASIMAFLPRKKWAVVIMANTGGSSADTMVQSLAYVLIDELLQTPTEERSSVVIEALEQQAEDAAAELFKDPKKATYPSAPQKSLSLSLPLDAYAGNYMHPAYQNLTVVLKKTPPYLSGDSAQPSQILQAALNRTFPRVLDFQHVSGEFFVVHDADAYTYEADQGGSRPGLHQLEKAEFRIGENGTVKEMGIALEPAMGDEKIWFQRL
ncbi:hypothetical protein MMC07_007925 [Pseudocyphellaria aurata]|nr:hypothetical protein [Pseudocyphellaria aurata]